jgi:NAD(P)-dependent dehydrogenase (short-subunit alcohol dehydrogenase family)
VRQTYTGSTEFEGQVAVVTGAGSGIGRAIAQSLARRGASVLVTDIDESRAEHVCESLGAEGLTAAPLRCDVTRYDDLVAARDTARSTWGRIDIVVNNVGVLAVGAPEAIPLDAWQHVVDVNLMSVVRSNDVFLPELIAQRRGHIVNTASVAALLNFSHDRLPYATSKAAVIALSEGLRLHLAAFGIGVTCLCPAGVATNIVEHMQFFGEVKPMVVPELQIVEADVVGELVAAAIRENRFLVFTDQRAAELLREKFTDVDAYLEGRMDRHGEEAR